MILNMTSYKKLFIGFSTFITVFFAEIAINLACGGETDPYDYYINYFHSDVSGDEYSPFFFTQLSFLYGDKDTHSESDINSEEWAKYLQVKKEDVEKTMYKSDAATNLLLSKLDQQSISSLPDSLQQNTFIQALGKNKKAAQYFSFAKSCEPLANSTSDYWNPVPRDTAGMISAAKQALDLVSSSHSDAFIKLRYAYQSARMYHYAAQYQECRNVYDKLIKTNKTTSAVKGWSMALYAGATRRLGIRSESAYLFSKVFESNPERRILAYRNYYNISPSTDSVLRFAKNNTERATIWAIEGFGNPTKDLKSLEEVYKNDPKSPINGALLVREINKLEGNILNGSSNYYYYNSPNNADSLKKVNLKHLTLVKNFALKLAEEKKYGQPELGTLTAAYLSWMENKGTEASSYLSKLDFPKLPERLKDQYRITDLLIKADQIKKGSPFNPNDLLPGLKWLDEKRFEENKPKPGQTYDDWGGYNKAFSLSARNLYQDILAPAYLKMGDTARAAMAMVKGDIRSSSLKNKDLFSNMSSTTIEYWQEALSPTTLLSIEKYRVTPPQDNLDGLLAGSIKQLNQDDFYELLGTSYLRTHNYKNALVWLQKINPKHQYFSASNWYEGDEGRLYPNAFIETIRDYPKQNGSKTGGLNKKTFAMEMLRLQKLVTSDPKNAAANYYKMANALYQTGYFGNSWGLISYSWSSYDNVIPPKYDYEKDYKQALTAKRLYLKARILTTDQNLKAKCTFMLAKCTQKMITPGKYPDYLYTYLNGKVTYKDYLDANLANPYYKEFSTKYTKTPFYQIAQGECSYFREFINRN
ncbi:hypothetical protein DBR11_00125 [Pedobacter sp. HMWF019]|nr:hypothetical protein DBR11_00125 [Pedobacter sp. HMWF019]